MSKYKIASPNKEYTSIITDVSFSKGEGYTENNWLASWFEGKGNRKLFKNEKR